MTKEEIMEVVNYIHANKEEFKPIVKKIVDLLLECGTEIKPIMEELNNYRIGLTTRTIQRYMLEEFSKEEAILLTLNNNLAVKEAFSNYKSKQ